MKAMKVFGVVTVLLALASVPGVLGAGPHVEGGPAGQESKDIEDVKVSEIPQLITKLEFEAPEIWETNFYPYQFSVKAKRSFFLEEYLMFQEGHDHKKKFLLVVDPTGDPEWATQTKGKELYWAHINATGTIPTLRYVNTTTRRTYPYYVETLSAKDFWAKHNKSFTSREPLPAKDVFFDLLDPDTNKIETIRKTMIEYQSFGLLRWQLSDQKHVTWKQINETMESLRPNPNNTATNPIQSGDDAPWEPHPSKFLRIENPCLPDLFLLYMILGDKVTPTHHVYMDIPAFHFTLVEPNFFNLTGAFCPTHLEGTNEECGHPLQLVLTNDHFIALTDKGVYVSSSLQRSDGNVGAPYRIKPLISYTLRDPCERFNEHISCFKQGQTSLAYDLIHDIRLFYSAICKVHQFPFYEDRLMLVIEHTVTNGTKDSEGLQGPPIRAISLLYASTPYEEWKALFIGMSKYDDLHVTGLAGVIFNHQLRHFDITIKVVDADLKNVASRRFVLPDPDSHIKDKDAVGDLGYTKIHGRLGDGFLEKIFPGSFDIETVIADPRSMDIFFIGNQMWIAEAGLSLVYEAVRNIHDNSYIRRCHFNSPDKPYVCTTSNNKYIIVGLIGDHSAPIVVDVRSIPQILNASGACDGHWTPDYYETVLETAYYTATHSGRVLLWYLFDYEDLHSRQGLKYLGADCTNGFESPFMEACLSFNEAWTDATNNSKPEELMKIQDTRFKERGAHFRAIVIEKINLTMVNQPFDGPLVPWFMEGQTLLLFEGRIPGDDDEFRYLTSAAGSRKIVCNYSIEQPPAPYRNCILMVRGLKHVDDYLGGFRQVVFSSPTTKVVPLDKHDTQPRTLPFVIVKTNVSVLVMKESNLAFIFLHSLKYNEYHVGWTHYFPGEFSVLLQGFPAEERHIMWGWTTVKVKYQRLIRIESYLSFLIDLSTKKFRDIRDEDWNKKEYEDYVADLESDSNKVANKDAKIAAAKEKIQKDYEANKYGRLSKTGFKLFRTTNPNTPTFQSPIDVLKAFANVSAPGATEINITSSKDSSWYLQDGGCNHHLYLQTNSYLHGHGGRINLDLHDSISFTVSLKAITDEGLLSLYHPLFVITNSNPTILRVDSRFVDQRANRSQHIKIMLSATGARMGVASLSVRSSIPSISCETGQVSFVVQIHRAAGRRLWAQYPHPICTLSLDITGAARPYKKNAPDCISHTEILQKGARELKGDKLERLTKSFVTLFTQLPWNYRPPSTRGEKIPLSEYTYRANPEKPQYNNKYQISNDSRQLGKCKFQATRADCGCSDGDKLSDDPMFSDCKEMVFTKSRGSNFKMKFEYDRLMPDSEQNQDFFAKKTQWSVWVEEINGRKEYSLLSPNTTLLQEINGNADLNEGKTFYDAQNLQVTLHGTGLFHFRVGLGKFDSFEDVTGYFMVYSESNELNHVNLVVVMLLTIICCFSLIFFGFIRVRKRLSSQLPFQTRARGKFKEE